MESADNKKLFAIYPSPVRKTYGVLLRFDDAMQVHYEISVSYVKTLEEDHFLFEIDKKQVYINNQEPDKMIEKLADEMGRVMYPLSVKTNKKGVIEQLPDVEILRERWNTQKESILRGYQGKVVDDGVRAMDAAFASGEYQLREMMRKDWFLALFFSGVYGLQAKDADTPVAFQLPMMAYAPLAVYGVNRSITERHDHNGCFTISYAGNLAEHWNAQPAKGAVNCEYKLYHADFTLRSVAGQANLIPQGSAEKKVLFEVYHLPEQDVLLSTLKAGAEATRESKEVKKSFWNIFK